MVMVTDLHCLRTRGSLLQKQYYMVHRHANGRMVSNTDPKLLTPPRSKTAGTDYYLL